MIDLTFLKVGMMIRWSIMWKPITKIKLTKLNGLILSDDIKKKKSLGDSHIQKSIWKLQSSNKLLNRNPFSRGGCWGDGEESQKQEHSL